MDPLRLFLLDQGFPVEYELDKFNTPHTGTTLFHPQNWLCRSRCLIPLRHLTTTSPLGNIFWRQSASPRNNQKHKLMVTPKCISSNGKHDFRYILRTYFPRTSNNTHCYLNSILTPFHLFTSSLSLEACSTNANSIFHAAIKTFRLRTSLSLFLYFSRLSEETTQRKHTHARYNFPLPNNNKYSPR